MVRIERACFRTLLVVLSLSLGACQSLSGEAAPSGERLQGVWRVTALANEPIPVASRAYIEFSGPPRLTGNAGCNRFFGIYDYQQGDLIINEALGASKMTCRPSEMAVENRLLKFLPQSRRVYLQEGRLELRDRQGQLLISARRESSS